MKKRIAWVTEKRKVKDLIPHKNNPRTLSKKSHDELLKSFQKFDYAELVAINTDNVILAGHQRATIMVELGWEDQEIEVRVPKTKLSDKDADEYLIRSNKNTGDWDFDILANNFEVDLLKEYGFEDKDFGLNDWESNLDPAIDTESDGSFMDVIKIKSAVGLKQPIIDLIKPVLKDLDVEIC